jgi:serine/threonine protein kinase/class 3 adenylate cyclase
MTYGTSTTYGYQLQAPLGANERCAAYRALRPDQTPVELRVLSESLVNTSEWPSIEKRLKLAAILDHPAIRRVHEAATDHRPPFVVIELLAGQTLDAVHRQSPLSLLRTVTLGRRLADGLAAAHRLGIIHGNINPAAIIARAEDDWTIDITGLDSNLATEPNQGDLRRFIAPEIATDDTSDLASDVFSLAAVVTWLLEGQAKPSTPAMSNLQRLLEECLANEPTDRPPAGQVAWRLAAVQESLTPEQSDRTIVFAPSSAGSSPATGSHASRVHHDALDQTMLESIAGNENRRLGRFELAEKLGEGGMGTVYRARDVADDATVAVKILNAQLTDNAASRRRFAKEARVLAKVNNPFVANLLDFNDDGGVHYLAVEFVPGGTLSGLLQQKGKFNETASLALVADVARGLAVAHQRGVVHRDIKPANLLLTLVGRDYLTAAASGHEELTLPVEPLLKLSDFGLARAAQQSESLAITNDGTVLGTPLYMSPEQCRGTPVDSRSDIYSLGATLFHLLVGRPPFEGESHVAVLNKHCHEPAPSLKQLRPEISEATASVVEKCLAKNPDARYADAAELLGDVERLLTGEPTSMLLHPAMPDSHGGDVLEFAFSCDLDSSPAQLWPYVANTDRVNHALGLPSVRYTTRTDPQRGVERFAEAKIAGQRIAWQEHPYEWIEGRRMSVLREFSVGPFTWFMNIVELHPRGGGGTRLTQTLKTVPRNWLGKWLAKWELGRKSPRSFTRVYKGIDKYLSGGSARNADTDAFGKGGVLSPSKQLRLKQRLDRLREQNIEPTLVETLGQFLEHASDLDVARIRPVVFAERFRFEPQRVVEACLRGAREGLLVLLWDILCPSCRIPADVQETLAALKDHGYCSACDLRYEIDFANSVELIFRAHPELRAVETRTYCIGGPAFSTHVVAHTRLAAGERFALELSLGDGVYRIRGPQLPFAVDLRVSPRGVVSRLDLPLNRPPLKNSVPTLRPGSQIITLINDTPLDLQVRLERTAARQLAFTAAEASSLALFREMFPSQVLSPGQIVSVTTVTLFQSQIHQAAELYQNLGDGTAFGKIRRELTQMDEVVRKCGGAVVKTVGEGVLATFADASAAVRAGLELLQSQRTADSLPLQVAIHSGPAMVTTLNDRLDYFGGTPHRVRDLLARAGPSELLLSETVAAQPEVAQMMRDGAVTADLLPLENGASHGIIHRWRILECDNASSL